MSTLFQSSWSENQTKILRDMHAAGKTAADIARAVGKTRNAVLGKVKRLGLATSRHVYLDRLKKAARARSKEISEKAIIRKNETKKKGAQKPSPETDYDRVDPSTPGLIRLADLSSKTCRYPLNNAAQGEYYFCGGTPKEGRPYCSDHCAVVYQPKKEASK